MAKNITDYLNKNGFEVGFGPYSSVYHGVREVRYRIDEQKIMLIENTTLSTLSNLTMPKIG